MSRSPFSRLLALSGALLVSIMGLVRGEIMTEGIAVIVNGQPITIQEIPRETYSQENEARLKLKGDELEKKIAAIRLQEMEDLIDRKLIIQAFRQSGKSYPETLIDQQLQATIKSDYQGDQDLFHRTLAAYGMTVDDFRRRMEENMIVSYMTKVNVDDKVIATIPADREKEAQALRQKWLEGLRKDATIQRTF